MRPIEPFDIAAEPEPLALIACTVQRLEMQEEAANDDIGDPGPGPLARPARGRRAPYPRARRAGRRRDR